MKYIQVKNIIGVMAVFIAFSFKTYGQQQDSTKRDNSLMSKAVKHNKKIPRLTYFIHIEDSIIQLFNVSVEKVAEEIEITGFATNLDTDKIEIYQSMRDNPKLKIEDENDKLNANQVHLFVQELIFDNGKVTVNQSSTNNYILYEEGMAKSNKKWKKPVLITAIVVGGVTGVIIIYRVIRAYLTDKLSS